MANHSAFGIEDGLVSKASLPRAAGKIAGNVSGHVKNMSSESKARAAGLGGTAAIVGTAAYKTRPGKKDRNISQSDIDRKKKYQAFSWRATGGLGLASMGLFSGAALKNSKVANKLVPATKRINPTAMKNAALGTSTTAGGIGGVAAMNSANISEAEARQHKKPIRKNSMTSAFGVDH